MTSSMLAGERKWASSRRGGMTVLGKVAVPKPINLPSQKLENHGLDPNVEIVPKGSLSWGSRPSSSSSNPWGSSAASTNADGTTVSPHHPSGRPTSGSGLSRPSTAGSDRHDPSATTWGPNSRPTSASGMLTSNQSSLTSSRPLSAETRPGSSHLSRFAEPVYDKSVAWGSNGTSDKMSVPSKVNDFSLSSGDFPTLGSEKDNTPNSSEPHDHGSHVRPGSGSGRHAPVKDRNEMAQADHNSGTVDRWTRDASPHFDDGFHHNADKWQGDSHQYVNPNVPPQHYDAWPGPPMNAPPGVWYRGPPPAGPPYSHVPHGGFPMEPFPYYHPQIPPPLANSQAGPPPGPGPRGHHPRNGEFYRPQMPDAFIRPGMPVRPGFYPGSVPYDGYYGPPMGYNPNDRERSLMGMPPGPPVYNMCPPQNPSEHNDPHFRGGVRGPVGNRFVSEQLDPLPPEESHGPYKVLKKHENERNADMDDSWDQNIEKTDHPRPSFHKNEWEANTRRNDDMPIRRNTLPNQGYPSDPVHIAQGSHNSKASNESWGNKAPLLEDPKNPTLIKKIEDLNAKVRGSDIRRDADQTNKILINPKGNSTITFGSISTTGDPAHPYDKSSQAPHGVRADHGNRADHHSKGRLSNQENHISHETNDTGESTIQTVDPADGQAQRARLREMAKQRAIELQKEEEERIREQKAKANAKLEELNRRTLAAADGTVQIAEKNCSSVAEQQDVDVSQKPIEKAIDTKAEVVTQISENSQQDPVDQSMLSKQSDIESKATRGNNGGVVNRQNRPSHRQKQSVQGSESSVDKSTVSEISGEVVKNSGINVTSSDKSTVSETSREVVKNSGINVTLSGDAIEIQEPTLPSSSNILSESNQHKKRNNKSSKNKHKLDDPSASREADHVKPESPQFDLNPTTVLVTGSKDAKQSSSNQTSKPQHSRRMPRNSHLNRHHVGEAAVWAPVRPQNKEETIQDDVTLPEKIINSGQNNLKSKRAEMERYVPKPVAKELAQQGSIIQSAAPSSPKITTLENMADIQTIPASSNVGPRLESKSGDNKQVKKTHGTGRQRDQGFQQDSKKIFHKSTSQHEEPMSVPTETCDGTGRHRDQRFQHDSKKISYKSTSQHEEPMSVPTETRDGIFHKSTSQHEEPRSLPTETSAVHEWDPSDGWFMPDEIPPTVATPVVKDEGKGKKPAYKGQRSTVNNHMESRVEVEVDQNERPASSNENRSSHWQPKPQAYKGGWSGGGQNANLEAKRESRKHSYHIRPDEASHDGRHEVRRERKPATFTGRTNSPNQNQRFDYMEDKPEARVQFEQQQHVSSGFRKNGGQNNRPSGQDDQRKNNYQHNANINREKQRPNLHYQYQPVGSNNNNSNRSSQLDAPSDAAPRYRERSSGQSRRGGGNFNGRQ